MSEFGVAECGGRFEHGEAGRRALKERKDEPFEKKKYIWWQYTGVILVLFLSISEKTEQLEQTDFYTSVEPKYHHIWVEDKQLLTWAKPLTEKVICQNAKINGAKWGPSMLVEYKDSFMSKMVVPCLKKSLTSIS